MLNESGMNGEVSGGGLSGAEALELSAQIAGLARAGLPLAPSLAALADELPRGRLRRSMRELAHGLESGQPLGEAVEGQERRIPAHLRGLMLAGIRSGRLGEVLGEFSGFAAVGVELRRRLWLNLAYPVLTLLLTLSVFAFVGIAVLPQLRALFQDFEVVIQWRPMMRMAWLLLELASGTAAIWPVFAAMAGALVVGGLAAHWFLPPAVARSLAGRVPLLGGVWRWTSLAEFSHLLALLLEHRLPMPEALRLAGEGVQDARVEVATRHMAEDVEDGRTMAGAMARRREFPPRLPRLLRWAENQGTLPEVLHMVGEMFAARASAHASFASTAVSAACFLMVITGVALIVSGLMVPLIILINMVSW